MAMFENFPYTDMHNLNLDWIIKIAKDFLDQYTSLQQMIADGEQSLTDLTQEGLNDLQEKADTLQGLLDAWYTEHSTDIANQLADALADLNEWYTTHHGYLNQYLQDSITAFNSAADLKAAQTIASIPDDYTTLSDNVVDLMEQAEILGAGWTPGFIRTDGTIGGRDGTERFISKIIPCIGGLTVEYKGENNHANILGVAFYDCTGTFISGDGNHGSLGDVTQVVAPAGTKYVRMTGTTLLTTNYIKFVNPDIGVISILQNEICDINYIDADYSAGYIRLDGTIAGTTGSERIVSKIIPCAPGTLVEYCGENNHANVLGIAFYDKDMNFISGDGNHGSLGDVTQVTAPEETRYMRTSGTVLLGNRNYIRFVNPTDAIVKILIEIQASDIMYVDGVSGSDLGLGDITAPLKTISKALEKNCSIIKVKAGTYTESLVIANRKSIKLFSYWPTYSEQNPSRNHVTIDAENENNNAAYINNCNHVEISGFEFINANLDGLSINNTDKAVLTDCVFKNNLRDGLSINYADIECNSCNAFSNGRDGFNINYFGNSMFVNCNGHDNGDDGISHHNGTTGIVIGGEWYNNVKGGIASPVFGAAVNVHDAYCHHNGYGMYTHSNADVPARSFFVFNTVMTNNTNYGLSNNYNRVNLYNCKFANNGLGNYRTNSEGSITIL